MAAISSTRLYSLIEDLIFPRRSPEAGNRQAEPIPRAADPLVCGYGRSSADTIDEAWLNRIELRGAHDVSELLAGSRFKDQLGSVAALFVDRRCGLIASEVLRFSAKFDADRAAAHVLRRASGCQASGVFLALNDGDGRTLRRTKYRDFVYALRRKGEVIDVYLLDEFVFSAGSWSRVSAPKPMECN